MSDQERCPRCGDPMASMAIGGYQCGHCWHIETDQAIIKRLRIQIATLQAENERLKVGNEACQRKLFSSEHQLSLHIDKAKGEYWAWQGDGEDHLESLVCPVLISADDLLALQSTIDKLPTYADTGEAFVPGVDEAFSTHHGTITGGSFSVDLEGNGRWYFENEHTSCLVDCTCYSTRKAAEAARGKE